MTKLISMAGAILLALSVAFSVPGTANAQEQDRGGCECATPSIDRLQHWLASGEGTTVPAAGSLLVPQGRGYAAKVRFVHAEWHVVVVWLGNKFEAQADLSRSAGFWMTYSATSDLYVQLRPASHWNGGAQWLTTVPSTGGKLRTRFFSFSPRSWTSLPELGAPAHPFVEALNNARGLVFVGKTENTLDFRGLRIDRYRPPCL
jgi:hypothetical protein